MAKCAHYAFCNTPGGGMERRGYDKQGKETERKPVKADRKPAPPTRKSALTGRGSR